MIIGNLAFQIFALEVRRAEPELFKQALDVAENNVIEAIKEDPSISNQLAIIDAIRGLAGILDKMK